MTNQWFIMNISCLFKETNKRQYKLSYVVWQKISVHNEKKRKRVLNEWERWKLICFSQSWRLIIYLYPKYRSVCQKFEVFLMRAHYCIFRLRDTDELINDRRQLPLQTIGDFFKILRDVFPEFSLLYWLCYSYKFSLCE